MGCNCGSTLKGGSKSKSGAKVIKINGQIMRPKSPKKKTKAS